MDGSRGGKMNNRIEFDSNRKRIESKFHGFGFYSFIKRIFSLIRLIRLIELIDESNRIRIRL